MFFGKAGKEQKMQTQDTAVTDPAVAAILDKVTVNTQSSIRIDAGKILRFDPFRIEGAPHDADVIFITHAHYDHFSPDDIEKVRKNGTLFVIPASMKKELSELGIDGDVITLLEPGETETVCGFPVETLPAYNRIKPFHPKKNGWLGYVVTVDGVRIYVAGDTDATDEAGEVKCDVAFLPIGGTYTMNAKEARTLALRLAPSAAVPTHYGSIVGSPSDYDVFAKGVDFAVRKLNFD